IKLFLSIGADPILPPSFSISSGSYTDSNVVPSAKNHSHGPDPSAGAISRVIDISASQGHVVPTAIAYHGNFFVGNLLAGPYSHRDHTTLLIAAHYCAKVVYGRGKRLRPRPESHIFKHVTTRLESGVPNQSKGLHGVL